MILDNEQQKTDLLNIIRMAPIQGPFEQMAQVVQAITQLKEKVDGAVVIQPGWEYSVKKKEE
jgi:hypothetical protein